MRTIGILSWWKPTKAKVGCLLFGHRLPGNKRACLRCGQRKKYKTKS